MDSTLYTDWSDHTLQRNSS